MGQIQCFDEGLCPSKGKLTNRRVEGPIDAPDAFGEAQRSRKEVPGRHRIGQRGEMFRTRASVCLETAGQDREWTEDRTLSH